MGGKKVKREERRREREGLDPKLFLSAEHSYPGTASPPACPTVQGARAWDSPGRSCPLEEPTKRTGRRMPVRRCNRLCLRPKVETKLIAKFRFPKSWD